MKKFNCPYHQNNTCYYQQHLAQDNEGKYPCSLKDREDYEMTRNSCWFPEKLTRSLKSTCPVASLCWLENKDSSSFTA